MDLHPDNVPPQPLPPLPSIAVGNSKPPSTKNKPTESPTDCLYGVGKCLFLDVLFSIVYYQTLM